MPDLPEETPEFSRPLRLNRLNKSETYNFVETPTVAEMAALAALYEAISVRKMRFSGTLSPTGKEGWQLDATLGATVTQPCVVTLAPVRTRIDIPVNRTFLPDVEENDLLDDGDEIEPLTPTIDLGLIATEALALALPLYPRAEGVSEADNAGLLGESVAEDAPRENPFAALAGLKDKLKNTPD